MVNGYEAERITAGRIATWDQYHSAFAQLEAEHLCRRPFIPHHCQHNGHMYYLLLPDLESRNTVMARLKQKGVYAIFHYIPLHSSPAGNRYARIHGTLSNTDSLSQRILRLPIWYGMTEEMIEKVITATSDAVREKM
ncbi:MAG: DegT/DnrJ/EryC1/StrS family aminotransferase [Nitrospirota bacterium]